MCIRDSGNPDYKRFQECKMSKVEVAMDMIRRAEDVAWAVARAFYIARSGRPGPVVLDFAKNAPVRFRFCSAFL